MDYPLLDCHERLKELLGDRLLVEWELAPSEYGTTKILRPDTHKLAFYVGRVLKRGPFVSEDIQEGDRIVFDRFSGVEGYETPDHRRLAILEESRQSAMFAKLEDGAVVDGESNGN